MHKGIFITFEGPDGSGKTTQVNNLAAWLKNEGREVICTREPGGTLAAEAIRQVVLDPKLPIKAEAETLLYLAARAEHVEKVIAPALTEGKVVLCDRFSDSTIVYQGYTRGMEIEALEFINTFATKGLTPDLTFLLDGEPKQLLGRRQNRGVEDRFELEGLAFQEQVRQGFLVLAKRYPERIKLVNSLAQPEIITEQLQRELKKFIAQKG